MLKWVKSNLETKNLSSKKGGVVVMKGKTKKKPPKAENGTLGNPSSKTSSAPQSTGRRGNESPTYPSSGLPDSGIQAPPYSPMGNRPNSAISSGAPPSSLPSMDKRSSYPTSRKAAPPISPSMGKGPAAQTYPESSGQSQDQNMYYTNDYNYSDEQSYLPDSTHSYHPHAQGVDLPPYSISQDSSQTYGQSSSKYDHSHSFGQSDYKKCASKVPVSYTPPVDTDHQPFEYDTYTKDYASPSHGTHQSSPYFDGSPAHVTGSPASSHGNGPPSYDHSGSSSPLGHSGPTSYCHSGQSSPHDPSRLSPLINHSGPSSPLGHSGQPSPQEYGNSSHASQYPRDDYNSYPQFNEGRQSPNHCSPFTQRYSNGYQESFPKQKRNSYDSSPKTPKGHYNPENVDKSYQVSTPLKHVSKSMLVKKPPRSPKTPVSMPFRSNEAPSPSIAAKALKNSPIEDYTNIVQPLPSKPGPQIPYKERLPKSPKKEIFVTFPDGKIVKQFVDPNMAMMDLLIQLTASKRLNPSGYLLVALSEEGNRPVDYKANQPVGLVNAHRVKLISKERVKTQQISQIAKTTEKQLPFEMTYRLTVNLPHGQKVVRRMSANHPLFELHESVCEEKNLDPNIFVFQLPDKPTSQVNLKYTLQELGLINYELNLVHRAEMDHYMSVPNLSNTESAWMSDQSTIKSSPNTTYVNVPPRGDSRKKRGFFSFLRKDKRGKSSGDLLNNRNNAKSRPASMFSPVTDTFESYLNKPKKSSKKKPAPPPPTGHPPATGRKPQDDHTGDPMQQRQRQQLPMHPPGEVINSGTDQGYQTFQKHSQANSDSSSCQRQRAATEPVPQSYKIETDSVERSDDMNHFSQPSSTKYHYLSDIPHRAPTEDDYLPENLGGKNVTPVSPQGLSVPLKTANDMYASPLKKRKPAPLPPPGGPQVRPKFDILSAAEKSDPDTPNLSNALDRPNSSHSTTVEQMEIANHASRTPLITIKTGPFTIENESTISLKDDTDIGIENIEKGNNRRVEIMDQKEGYEEKLEFPDQVESTKLIVEDLNLSISSEIASSVHIKSNELKRKNLDQKAVNCFGKENHIQNKINDLIVETPDLKKKSDVKGEITAQTETDDLIPESLVQIPFHVEASDLCVESPDQVEANIETPTEIPTRIEINDLEEETPVQIAVCVETSTKDAAQEGNSFLIAKPPDQVETVDFIVEHPEINITDAKRETFAKEVIANLSVENTFKKSSDLKEMPAEIECNDLVVENPIQSVIIDLKVGIPIIIGSTDLNVETTSEANVTDLKIAETLAKREDIELNIECPLRTKGCDIAVESVDPVMMMGLNVETPSSQVEGTVFKIETMARDKGTNLNVECASQEKIPDFIVEKPAEDNNSIIEAQDEGIDVEADAESVTEQISMNDSVKYEVSANNFATFEEDHIGKVGTKLLRPCSFNAPPPPPLSPPPGEPPTDIPSPIIIIGTEMVDKSVGISEDSTSLTANDTSPHGGHARSLSKVSTASSLGTAEEVTCAFDETIAVAEEALQNELMDQMTKAPAKGEEQQMEQKLFVEQLSKASSEETLNVSPTATTKQAQSKRATESRAVNGSTEGKFAATPPYVEEMNSVVNDRNKHLSDTITHNVALHNDSPKKKNSDIISISSDGSFTTIGTSDVSTNSVHNAEAEVNHVIKETIEVKQYDNGITEIQIPVPQKQTQSSAENEKIGNSKTSVIEMEHFQVNGMEIGIEKTAALTKTKIGQQVTVIRPNLETSASLELSRSSSAAELAQYMESPKEELLLTKQDRQGLDYRGSPLVEVQKKLEELKKEEKQVPSKEESPKIMLQVSNLSFDSESEIRSGDIESGPQGNLKKQIEHWQKQLQEHLSDNSNLYTHQEQDKLKQKVDLWNKQLKELNVMDTSGFRLLEQNVLKQQIELWQRKLLAKERQHDGRKKFQEQETEFLKKQIEVWKKKIEVIEKCADLYTTEERDVLQQQIDLWQCQLTKDDNMDTDEKEQNLLKRQIDVWKKNLREKKFAGYAFSQQEQDILKQQLNVWQKQLHCCKTGSVSTKREILKEQIEVWQLQLQDVQRNPSDDSQIEQEILEQQIELWQSKLSQKDNLSEEIMLKQIDIWKQQMDSNRKIDDQYLVQERMIIEKEIQLWNKRLSGDDVECENFIALEQDLLHEKIELCQQKLKNNIATDSPDIQLEQEVLKLQVDLWQQKVSAMQEKKLAVINYKEEEQDILKTQIKLWEDKLIKPSEKNSAVAISERGTELLAREVDLWQRWLDVKKEKKESRIKLKLLDEELQKEQIRLWQGHLEVIKNETLGYTEEERDILMQQIELWQKGLTEKKDGKTIHLAVEQEILKKYIDLWYNKMRRNTASSISEERDDVRLQIDIWKKQLNMYTLDDHPLSHSARQDIINQQIAIWQKKRERCSVGADELTKIESEILQQQIELWQKDLMEYEQRKATVDKEMPKEQIKLLKRTLSQRKKDIDPEILEQEKAIVNRQIDLYQKKLDNGHELDSSDFINDEQKILEEQIDLWHRKLCLPDEGKAFYSESEYDILQKQVSLWHQQLVAIQHRQEYQRRLALQEQNLLKEQINLWEIKLEAFPDPVFMVEEQDAMKDQIELWQQQLEEHKGIILNKTASTPDDPELRKMELMLKSQEEIIQSFKEGLKNLPENLKTRASPPPVLSPPISAKETKPVRKVSLEFPPPPETFRDEDFTAVKLKQTVPKPPPKPPTPPPLSHALANLKKIDQPERPASPVNEQDGILRAVPAVVLKKPALARKPKRKLPEPVLSPREELMLEIKNFAGRSKLKGSATYKNEPI